MTGATTGLRVHLYRYRHPDGAEKDWAYPVRLAPNALTVFYGRTGAALRQADTPTLHCRGCNPATEAQARVQEKLAKGYRGLGEFWLAADRRQLTPAAPVGPPAAPALAPPPAAEPPPPCWYWRWTPGPVPPPRQAAVEAACTAALARLAAVGWTLPDHRPGDDGPTLWARLTETTRSGVVEQRAGNEPQLAFWLLMARHGPAELRLVDDNMQPVRRWPAGQLPVAAAILETLGLPPHNLGRLLAAGDGGAAWFF